MRCLINQLCLPERALHRLAQKLLRCFHGRAEAEPGTASIIVLGLMGDNGVTNFDQRTRTKTVEKLMIQSSAIGLMFTVSWFERLIRHPRVDEEKAGESQRQILADQLLTLVRSRHTDDVDLTPEDHEFTWPDMVLYVFSKFGYFIVGDMHEKPNTSPSPPVSEATRSLLRSRLTSCLVHLMSKPQGAIFPYSAVHTIKVFGEDDGDGGTQPLFQADDKVRRKLKHAWKLLDKIHAKVASTKDRKRAYLQAFDVLYSLTILQIYNGDADAVLVLDELKTCYDSLVKHSTDSDEASELLVEVLLSFASKPSALFRKLAEQVFTTFASEINAAGLQAMVKVKHTVVRNHVMPCLTAVRSLRRKKTLQASKRCLIKRKK